MRLEKGTFGQFPAYLCKGRNPIQQALLSWLWFHQNAEGTCFPSLKTLAEECGTEKRSISRHLTILENDGLIKKTNRKKEGSKENDSNIYEVLMKVVTQSHKVVNKSPHPIDTESPQVVTQSPSNQIQSNQIQLTTPVVPKGTHQSIIDFFNSNCGTELKLTDKKSNQLKERLKTYSVDEIEKAILARKSLPFYRGENSDGTVWYKDWDSLFRNDEKIERVLNSSSVPVAQKQNAPPPERRYEKGKITYF